MFALAIWDKKNKNLFLARDRFGEKPLIYFWDSENFYFASEFKGLIPLLPSMPSLNMSVVDMYMYYQYAPEPFTLLENVHKLAASHYANLDLLNWTLKTTEYWNSTKIDGIQPIRKEDVKHELDNAVKLTMRSDVPIAVALSAGIDSAAIAAFASRHSKDALQTFCVGYDGRPSYDEREEARTIAEYLGCTFNEIEIQTSDFVKNFDRFAGILDEPVADIAALDITQYQKRALSKI